MSGFGCQGPSSRQRDFDGSSKLSSMVDYAYDGADRLGKIALPIGQSKFVIFSAIEARSTKILNLYTRTLNPDTSFPKMPSHRPTLLALIGLLLVIILAAYRHSLLPEEAPAGIRESGIQLIRENLDMIRNSRFGESQRGGLLSDRVAQFLKEDRIHFSSKLGGPRGMWRNSIIGRERIYLRVLEMNHGRYVHQLPDQLIEVVFHEAVHSLHGRFHRSSIEEECDAFVAGMTAEALVRGEALPSVFIIDGVSLGEFVLNAYS